ncbi:MAG: cupredoxin domain-containing protein [Anaerolineales bacterium]
MRRTLLFLFVLALPACLPARELDTPFILNITPPAMSVYITDESCPSVEVQSGQTVDWINQGAHTHVVQTAIQEDGTRILNSGPLEKGDGFAITFDKPETLPYQCSEDGALTGTITVTELPDEPSSFTP